jgi:hypothetical protein
VSLAFGDDRPEPLDDLLIEVGLAPVGPLEHSQIVLESGDPALEVGDMLVAADDREFGLPLTPLLAPVLQVGVDDALQFHRVGELRGIFLAERLRPIRHRPIFGLLTGVIARNGAMNDNPAFVQLFDEGRPWPTLLHWPDTFAVWRRALGRPLHGEENSTEFRV